MKRKFVFKALISREFCSFSLTKKGRIRQTLFWFLKFFWHVHYLHYVVIVYNINAYSIGRKLFEPFCAFQFMLNLDCNWVC